MKLSDNSLSILIAVILGVGFTALSLYYKEMTWVSGMLLNLGVSIIAIAVAIIIVDTIRESRIKKANQSLSVIAAKEVAFVNSVAVKQLLYFIYSDIASRWDLKKSNKGEGYLASLEYSEYILELGRKLLSVDLQNALANLESRELKDIRASLQSAERSMERAIDDYEASFHNILLRNRYLILKSQIGAAQNAIGIYVDARAKIAKGSVALDRAFSDKDTADAVHSYLVHLYKWFDDHEDKFKAKSSKFGKLYKLLRVLISS